MEIINVVTIRNGVVDEIKSFLIPFLPTTLNALNIRKKAEYHFLQEAIKLGFDELNEDSNFILDGGYYEKENRSVCISWSEIIK